MIRFEALGGRGGHAARPPAIESGVSATGPLYERGKRRNTLCNARRRGAGLARLHHGTGLPNDRGSPWLPALQRFSVSPICATVGRRDFMALSSAIGGRNGQSPLREGRPVISENSSSWSLPLRSAEAGIGAQLVDAVERLGRCQWDARSILVHQAGFPAEDAHRFYEGMWGYARTGVPIWRKQLEKQAGSLQIEPNALQVVLIMSRGARIIDALGCGAHRPHRKRLDFDGSRSSGGGEDLSGRPACFSIKRPWIAFATALLQLAGLPNTRRLSPGRWVGSAGHTMTGGSLGRISRSLNVRGRRRRADPRTCWRTGRALSLRSVRGRAPVLTCQGGPSIYRVFLIPDCLQVRPFSFHARVQISQPTGPKFRPALRQVAVGGPYGPNCRRCRKLFGYGGAPTRCVREFCLEPWPATGREPK